MPKIIHGADFHLDSSFAGLPPEKARQRRRESRELLDALAELVRTEKADLVLLAGDLFDGERVYPETLERLRSALGAMACPVFIAPGNHDPYTPYSPYAAENWPENVHIFRSPEIEAVELPKLGCMVHGCAFAGPERTDQALAGFTVPTDGKLHLMCLHGDVGVPDSTYGPVTRQQIGSSGLAYLALGHIHQYSGVNREEKTSWAYPGCPEGRGFDELGDKGVLVGTVDEKGADLRFVPLCHRRYHIVSVDVTGREPREALAEALPETAAEDVCRFVLTGETGEGGVDLPALETAFTPRCYVLQLRDQTRPAEDIWKRAGEDTLRGLFLQDLRQRWEAAADEEERQKIALAVRFGLAALDGRDL